MTSVSGKTVESPNELRNAIAAIHPGQKVPIELVRNGKKMSVTVTLTARDAKKTSVSASSGGAASGEGSSDMLEKLGIKTGNLTSQQYEELDLDPALKGVIVLEVEPGSQL